MMKKYTYVKCQGCAWQLENFPDRDWAVHPCLRCKNTRQVINPAEVLCNLCGECMCPLGTMNEQYPHGLHEAKITGGYDSYHLFDMTTYVFSFCEKCLRRLFNECKIKPSIYNTSFDGELTTQEQWEQDQESYEYRLWRDNGGHHQAFLDRKCNAKKDCPNIAVHTILYNDNIFSEECCCEEHKGTRQYSNTKYVKFIPNNLKAFL